jgi:hypothetical protein
MRTMLRKGHFVKRITISTLQILAAGIMVGLSGEYSQAALFSWNNTDGSWNTPAN